MDTSKITGIIFSPTGTTKRIIEAIAGSTGISDIQMIDITKPDKREAKLSPIDNELVIVGIPVYYGRIPELIIPWLRSLKGHNTRWYRLLSMAIESMMTPSLNLLTSLLKGDSNLQVPEHSSVSIHTLYRGEKWPMAGPITMTYQKHTNSVPSWEKKF